MSLPTFNVQNEVSPNLRLRNRKSLNDSNYINSSIDDSGYASPDSKMSRRNNMTTGIEATETMTTSSVYRKAPNTSTPSVYCKAPDTPPSVELQQRWNSTSDDLWGTVVKGESFKDLIPVAVAFIVMTSCVVLVCTLTFGLDRDPLGPVPDGLNGKYKSIAFANDRRMKRDSARAESGQLKDENGVVLGGKKASIQFAHDFNKAEENQVDSEKMDEKALLDQLTFKMASNIINDLAKAAKVKDLKKVEAQKPAESLDRSKRDTDANDEDAFGFARQNSMDSFRIARRIERTARVAKKEAAETESDRPIFKKRESAEKPFRKL